MPADVKDDLVRFRAAVLAHLTAYSVKIALPGDEFVLSSGAKSRLYIDAKRSTLHRSMHQPLALLLHKEVAAFGFIDAVAGVVLGGSHLASIVASSAAVRGELLYNVLCVRRAPKDHGTRHQVEAPAPSRFGERVVVLEDVLSTGASAASAIVALREAGYNVRGCVTLLDRRPALVRGSLGGIAGVPLRALFVLEDLSLSEEIVSGARVSADPAT